MAFAYTQDGSDVQGSKRRTWGTYTSSSSGVGGEVFTGLRVCETFSLKPKGSAVAANQSVLNETFPVVRASGAASAAITIVTDADQVGTWEAVGR